MAAKPKFTRIPKIPDLVAQGVPTEVIPTYCCLADFANNKTGLCWPKMETLAAILKRSVRTIQRHVHLLKELGLIEFVERRRHKGRFSSYTHKISHIVTTGHARPVEKLRPILCYAWHPKNAKQFSSRYPSGLAEDLQPGVSAVLRVREGSCTSPARGASRSGRSSAGPPRPARCERDARR